MRQESLDLGLKPTQSLANFYPGPNQDILALLEDWLLSIGPDLRPMPIYIWGEAGSGKTHLLKAVMNAAQSAGKKGIYLSAKDFSANETLDFDTRWQLMVLDDVQLLDSAQEAVLFNWFIQALLPKRWPVPGHFVVGGSSCSRLGLARGLAHPNCWGHGVRFKGHE
jgi:DnaA family protein